MNFSVQDVKQLYGSLLFRIGEHPTQPLDHEDASQTAGKSADETPPTVPPAILKQGNTITWKLKPDSTLALILTKSDYLNKEFTGYLKQCLQQSGVPLDKIGFGIYPDNSDSLDLQDIPTPAGILFSTLPGLPSSPVQWNQHTIFIADSLQQLAEDQHRQSLVLTLRQAQEWMNPS